MVPPHVETTPLGVGRAGVSCGAEAGVAQAGDGLVDTAGFISGSQTGGSKDTGRLALLSSL